MPLLRPQRGTSPAAGYPWRHDISKLDGSYPQIDLDAYHFRADTPSIMCGVGFIADLHGESRHRLLPLALEALSRLAHRGAVDADGRTGDGAGVMTEIPRAILGLPSSPQQDQAVGAVFLPRQTEAAACARRLLATSLASHGLLLNDWREVPIDESALGEKAR